MSEHRLAQRTPLSAEGLRATWIMWQWSRRVQACQRSAQRKLLVAALRQRAGVTAGSSGGAGANGEGYVTEDETDFDFDEYACSGVT